MTDQPKAEKPEEEEAAAPAPPRRPSAPDPAITVLGVREGNPTGNHLIVETKENGLLHLTDYQRSPAVVRAVEDWIAAGGRVARFDPPDKPAVFNARYQSSDGTSVTIQTDKGRMFVDMTRGARDPGCNDATARVALDEWIAAGNKIDPYFPEPPAEPSEDEIEREAIRALLTPQQLAAARNRLKSK